MYDIGLLHFAFLWYVPNGCMNGSCSNVCLNTLPFTYSQVRTLSVRGLFLKLNNMRLTNSNFVDVRHNESVWWKFISKVSHSHKRGLENGPHHWTISHCAMRIWISHAYYCITWANMIYSTFSSHSLSMQLWYNTSCLSLYPSQSLQQCDIIARHCESHFTNAMEFK